MPGSDSDSWTIGAHDPTRVIGVDEAASSDAKALGDSASPPALRPSGPAIGGGGGGGQKFAFALSAIALGLSVATLVIVLITYLNDDSNPPTDGIAAAGSSATPTAAGSSSTQQPVAATQGPNAQPTATAPANTVAEIPLPCGDPMVPLDKQHVLGRDCQPTDLEPLPPSASTNGTQLMRSEARAALLDMLAAAENDKLTMVASSSYRSYDQQVATFQGNVQSGGQAYAERTSARAGHSEHQLGTTTDLTSKSAAYQLEQFEGTPEAKWLAENCWKFGFIISYPSGKENITGYAYEPWHVRYVGKDVALKVKNSGLTLHEFLLK